MKSGKFTWFISNFLSPGYYNTFDRLFYIILRVTNDN